MKKLLSLLAVTLLCRLSTPPALQARTEVSVDVFYEALEPYGEWIEVEDYGYCWHSLRVDSDWQPYTVGHWVYTDAAWTWASDEPWGWATYHYGRWIMLADVGWVWVPDVVWGPAWVTWRSSETYVGWAPLPPEATWDSGTGFGVWVDAYYDIGPRYYSFVAVRDLGAPVIREVIVQRSENITIINQTTNITHITYANNLVRNEGPDFEAVSKAAGRPIPRLKLERITDADLSSLKEAKAEGKIEGDHLKILAPEIKSTAAAKPAKVARKIEKSAVDHGWKGVANEESVKARIAEQAKDVPKNLAPKPTVKKKEVAQPIETPREIEAPVTEPKRSEEKLPEKPEKVPKVVPPEPEQKERKTEKKKRPQERQTVPEIIKEEPAPVEKPQERMLEEPVPPPVKPPPVEKERPRSVQPGEIPSEGKPEEGVAPPGEVHPPPAAPPAAKGAEKPAKKEKKKEE